MNVSESKFRQILREEARRVLREAVPTGQEASAAPATPAKLPPSLEWNTVNGALGALISSLSSTPSLAGAQKITIDAQRGWAKCKDKASPQLAAAVDAMAAVGAGNPPSKLAVALVSLSGGTQLGGGAMATLMSGLTATDQQGLAGALATAAPKIVDNIVKHSSPAAMTTAPAAVTAGLDLTYTVKSGDSLSKILRDYYNIPASNSSMQLYKDFATRSLRSHKPELIYVGEKIKLPQTLTFSGKNHIRQVPAQ